MRQPFKWSVLLAAMLFGFTMLGGTGVGAQEMEEDFQPSDLEGIQYGVARSYSIDYSAISESMSTPGTNPSMPSGVLAMNGMVLEFDNDDNAETAFDTMVAEFDTDEDFAETGVEPFEIDLGNKSTSFSGSEDSNGIELKLAVTVVQDGSYVYMVAVTGSDIDSEQVVKDFTQKLIDNDGSGEGEFSETGESTGGLWDKFPGADDEQVGELMPVDVIVYPETNVETDDA